MDPAEFARLEAARRAERQRTRAIHTQNRRQGTTPQQIQRTARVIAAQIVAPQPPQNAQIIDHAVPHMVGAMSPGAVVAEAQYEEEGLDPLFWEDHDPIILAPSAVEEAHLILPANRPVAVNVDNRGHVTLVPEPIPEVYTKPVRARPTVISDAIYQDRSRGRAAAGNNFLLNVHNHSPFDPYLSRDHWAEAGGGMWRFVENRYDNPFNVLTAIDELFEVGEAPNPNKRKAAKDVTTPAIKWVKKHPQNSGKTATKSTYHWNNTKGNTAYERTHLKLSKQTGFVFDSNQMGDVEPYMPPAPPVVQSGITNPLPRAGETLDEFRARMIGEYNNVDHNARLNALINGIARPRPTTESAQPAPTISQTVATLNPQGLEQGPMGVQANDFPMPAAPLTSTQRERQRERQRRSQANMTEEELFLYENRDSFF